MKERKDDDVSDEETYLGRITVEHFSKVNAPELKSFILCRCGDKWEASKVRSTKKGRVSDVTNDGERPVENLLTLAFEVRSMDNLIHNKIRGLQRWINQNSNGTAAVIDDVGREGGNETDTFEPLSRRVQLS